jgi:3-oxoadipate enol-lactonase
MDLRGHGRSQFPPVDRALTLDRLVRDVRELMDHLGCARAHIVGNSAGGYLGQQLAMEPRRASDCAIFAAPAERGPR